MNKNGFTLKTEGLEYALKNAQKKQYNAIVDLSKLYSFKISSHDGTIVRESFLQGLEFQQEQSLAYLFKELSAFNLDPYIRIICILLNLKAFSLEGIEEEERREIMDFFSFELKDFKTFKEKVRLINQTVEILKPFAEMTSIGDIAISLNFALSDIFYKMFLLGIRADILLASSASSFFSSAELNQLYSRITVPEDMGPANLTDHALFYFIKKMEGDISDILSSYSNIRTYALDLVLKINNLTILDMLLRDRIYLQELFLMQDFTIPAIAHAFLRGDYEICKRFLEKNIWRKFTNEQKVTLLHIAISRSGLLTRDKILEKTSDEIDLNLYNSLMNLVTLEEDRAIFKQLLRPIIMKNLLNDIRKGDDNCHRAIINEILKKMDLDDVELLLNHLKENGLLSVYTYLEHMPYIKDLPRANQLISILESMKPGLISARDDILANPINSSLEDIFKALYSFKLEDESKSKDKTKKAKESLKSRKDKYVNKNLDILYEKAKNFLINPNGEVDKIILDWAKEIAGLYEAKEKERLLLEELTAEEELKKLNIVKKKKKEKSKRKKNDLDKLEDNMEDLTEDKKMTPEISQVSTNDDHKPSGGDDGGVKIEEKATQIIVTQSPIITVEESLSTLIEETKQEEIKIEFGNFNVKENEVVIAPKIEEKELEINEEVEIKFGFFDQEAREEIAPKVKEQEPEVNEAIEIKFGFFDEEKCQANIGEDQEKVSKQQIEETKVLYNSGNKNALILMDGFQTYYPYARKDEQGLERYFLTIYRGGYPYEVPLMQDVYGNYLYFDHYNANFLFKQGNETTGYYDNWMPPGGGGEKISKRKYKNYKKTNKFSNKKDNLSDLKLEEKVVLVKKDVKELNLAFKDKPQFPKIINQEKSEYDDAKQEAEKRDNNYSKSSIDSLMEFFADKLSDFNLYAPANIMLGVFLTASNIPEMLGMNVYQDEAVVGGFLS